MERGEEPWAGRFHEYYDRVDASVGELVRRLPDDCTVILLSDHGFCRLDREVYVNRWLERDGWVALEEPAKSIASVIPERTRAYCMDPGRLYLNLEGREPGGIVPPGGVRRRPRGARGVGRRPPVRGPCGDPRGGVLAGRRPSSAPTSSWSRRTGGI